MPFENLSEDKANAYFADGIQDEILTRLSKNAVARVSYYSPAFENKYALKIELDVAF